MKPYLKIKDHAVSQETFELHLDTELQLLTTTPVPKDLDRYYESPSYISHTDAKQTFFDRTYQQVKRFMLGRKVALVARYAANTTTLLDIGAGTGDFVLAAEKAGWKVAGVEPNLGAREKASSKGIQLHEGLQLVEGNRYRAITLWHVLEHIYDVKSTIAQLQGLLEEEGILVIAVPNFRSRDAKHYRSYWAGFDVPRHLWHFSRDAIERLFAENGMQLVATRPMWFDAFYVAILSERYKKNSWPFLRGLCVGLWSNCSAMFTKEWSSHIYVLKNYRKAV